MISAGRLVAAEPPIVLSQVQPNAGHSAWLKKVKGKFQLVPEEATSSPALNPFGAGDVGVGMDVVALQPRATGRVVEPGRIGGEVDGDRRLRRVGVVVPDARGIGEVGARLPPQDLAVVGTDDDLVEVGVAALGVDVVGELRLARGLREGDQPGRLGRAEAAARGAADVIASGGQGVVLAQLGVRVVEREVALGAAAGVDQLALVGDVGEQLGVEGGNAVDHLEKVRWVTPS